MNKKWIQKSKYNNWVYYWREIIHLGEYLSGFYNRFRGYTQTKTRDTSAYGLRYLSGLLRMETDRNLANVGPKTIMPGQNFQHFNNNSPWSGPELIQATQNEIKVHPTFQEAVLVLGESAEEKSRRAECWSWTAA